ncbi:MAG: M48 family metallopeptidase [Acidobacteria bacterium]|nr:M48 family metallopeptidase [Acidobacteriota bacterium]
MVVSANTSWKGYYYDGRTARRHSVTVSLTSAGVYIKREEGQTLWWLHDQVRLAQGHHPGEPVRLETMAEISEALVVEDRGFLDAFLFVSPPARNLASGTAERLNRSLPLLLAGLLGAAFLIYATWVWGLPAFADAAARRVPASWEDKLGQSVMEQFAPPDERCNDPDALAKIQEIIRVMRGPNARGYEVTLAVADTPIPNAFAAPGGYVVVFRGLLEQTENAEDLAGMLAHEIQHVEQRHAMKGLVRQLSVATLVAVLAGDASAIQSLLDAAATLGSLRYQRDDEANADTEAVRMLQAARIDATGLPRMLERMSSDEGKEPGGLQYLSSHPLTADRVRRLTALAVQHATDAVPLLKETDWKSVAFMCGPPDDEATDKNSAAANER